MARKELFSVRISEGNKMEFTTYTSTLDNQDRLILEPLYNKLCKILLPHIKERMRGEIIKLYFDKEIKFEMLTEISCNLSEDENERILEILGLVLSTISKYN